MDDSDATRKKFEILIEIQQMVVEEIKVHDLYKYHYQDLKHVRNSLRKALREAGLR